MVVSTKRCYDSRLNYNTDCISVSVYFYFLFPISRENIVFGSNFRSRDFDGFTRFEVPLLRKLHILCLVSVYVCLCACYQHNSKTNYSRNIKFGILHLYTDAT